MGDAREDVHCNAGTIGTQENPSYMSSSRTITLFTENRDTSQGPASLAASILFHAVGLALVSFGVLYTPRLDRKAASHYIVRKLDLDMPDTSSAAKKAAKIGYPTLKPAKLSSAPGAHLSALRQPIRAPRGPQTILQPDLPKQIALHDLMPLPTLMVWSPSKTPVKAIIAPQPASPTAANVTPSAAPPIQEVNLADVNIATSPIEQPKLPVMASSTSPVRVQAPLDVQLPPSTITQVSAQPTPAAVLSLSDLQMKQGTVVLPPANQSAADNVRGALAAGQAWPAAPTPGDTAGSGDGGATPTQGASAAGASTGGAGNSGAANLATATRITLPRDGQFGAVVVGASLEDEFPQMNRVWSGRLAYTVYLHVGLPRSWILQYSLPLADAAQSMGTVARLEAPWPFNIVRPNLGSDPADAETIMVHGYVNQSGRFEGLRVLFPEQFRDAQFVLASLGQWQFRPAERDGQPARVEVLLIIPEELQ